MKSMCNKFILIPAFIMLIMITQSHAENQPKPPTAEELPVSLIGIWQVLEAHVDTGATRTLLYQHNDFRLTGRLFTIERDKLITDAPEDQLCTNPKITTTITTPVDLIGRSMAGRGLPPETPTPQDYELTFSNNKPIEVLSINCKEGLFAGGLGADGGIGGAWIIALNDDKLAIRWYDETILVLNRLPTNAKPKASFNCEKTVTTVEKTICGSVALAAFDNSIAQSYLFVAKQYKELTDLNALNQLRARQKKWLIQRNKCGSDADCLQKSMADRLEAIENELISQGM